MGLVYQRPPSRQPTVPRLNAGHELLAGGTLEGLIVGGHALNLAAPGSALTVSGTVSSRAAPGGIGFYQSGAAGDIGFPIAVSGGSVEVWFWHGIYYSGGSANGYFAGDFNGVDGRALTGRHPNIGGNWGFFIGANVEDSGETLVSGQRYTFVVSRPEPGNPSVYRDGALKFTCTSNAGSGTGFAVGSAGINQYAAQGCESTTFLAGRLRFRGWSAEDVKSFSRNPWQIFAPLPRVLLAPVTAGGGGSTWVGKRKLLLGVG